MGSFPERVQSKRSSNLSADCFIFRRYDRVVKFFVSQDAIVASLEQTHHAFAPSCLLQTLHCLHPRRTKTVSVFFRSQVLVEHAEVPLKRRSLKPELSPSRVRFLSIQQHAHTQTPSHHAVHLHERNPRSRRGTREYGECDL